MSVHKAKLIEFFKFSDERGSLASIDLIKEIPFEVKRIYYLFDTQDGQNKGAHAHKKLEQVIYFASYIITDVYEDKREEALKKLENAYKNQKILFQKEGQQLISELNVKLESKEISKKEFHELESMHMAKLDELEAEYTKLKDLLKQLKEGEVIEELDYRVVYDKFPHCFKGGTGAEHLEVLLKRIDLKEFITTQQAELRIAPKSRQKKILQRLKLATNLFKSAQRPENFPARDSRCSQKRNARTAKV